MASAAGRSEVVTETLRVSPERAAEQIASNEALKVIDVRAAGERAAKSIANSTHIPLQRLVEDTRGMPRETPHARSLRRRLSVIDRREPPSARGIHECDRAGWRAGSVGGFWQSARQSVSGLLTPNSQGPNCQRFNVRRFGLGVGSWNLGIDVRRVVSSLPRAAGTTRGFPRVAPSHRDAASPSARAD